MDMIKEKKIPAGYKNTNLGPIPLDWNIVKLSKIAEFKNGKAHENCIDDNGKFIVINSKFVSTSGNDYKKSNENLCPLKIDDITMVMSDVPDGRAIAKCYLIEENNRYTLNQRVCSIHSVLMSNKFLYYLLNRNNYFLQFDDGVKQTNLRKEEILDCPIQVPPLPEQTAIADLLSTWDKAIQTTNTLIEQKQNRKKWLMQMLLTGKKRLKGFEKEKWVTQKISAIAKEISIRNKEDKDLVVLSCTKYDGLVPSLEYFGRKIYSDDLTTYKIVPISHFAYATNHIEEGSIGYQTKLDLSLISPMYTVFKTDGSVDDIYLYRVLKSQLYIHEYKKRMEGSIDRRGGLRWEEFSKIKVPVPSIKEQNAISTFFVVVDKEIELLKSKLEQLKEQKKGLMQILLTGKKRLN